MNIWVNLIQKIIDINAVLLFEFMPISDISVKNDINILDLMSIPVKVTMSQTIESLAIHGSHPWELLIIRPKWLVTTDQSNTKHKLLQHLQICDHRLGNMLVF